MRKALLVAVVSLLLIGGWTTLPASGSMPQEGVPSWTDDIGPLMAANCMSCHRPGQVAPMSLLSYDDVVPWARSIRMVVGERIMPPWHADPQWGHFVNDRRLSEDEIGTMMAWIEAGTPRGDGTFTAPTYVDGDWSLAASEGPPDYVFEMDEEWQMPAAGPDIYQHVYISTTHTEDIWLRGLEARGNSRIVHHIDIMAEHPDESRALLGIDLPGKPPDFFPEGNAILFPAGAQLRLTMHYHPNGEPQTNRTRVGVWLARSPVQYQVIGDLVTDQTFEIPPYEPNYEHRAEKVFEEEADLLVLNPHMHYRGTDFMFQLVHPDGREETLLYVPNYNIYWQMVYKLTEPIHLAKGAKLRTIGHFDNSANNPWNPNPSVRVIYGMDSRDEMFEGWLHYRRKLEKPVMPSYGELTTDGGAR